ncbi:hypothetical protein HYR99_02710 [Candidatus Poribacteria bacterium]|nr:hypothetical protein [Candidatus Poribacteria bacterium]
MKRLRSSVALVPGFIFAFLGLLTGCGSSEDGQRIEIYADEFSFAPSQIRAVEGEITFVVTNRGKATHEFMVYKPEDIEKVLEVYHANPEHYGSHEHPGEHDEADLLIAQIEYIGPGETAETTVTVEKGTYEIGCHLSRHYETGMKAILKVN